MMQVTYFVLRRYIRTGPMGPVLDGIELLLISFPPRIFTSQDDARIAQVPAALWASWWCTGISLPVFSFTWPTTAVRSQHYKGLYLPYVYSTFFFYCLFMTVTQKLCSILIIRVLSKKTISITSTSISVFGPQDSI